MIQNYQEEHVGKAVAWLMFGVVGGLLLDLVAKEILRTYSLPQFVLLRSFIAILILLAIAPRFGGLRALRTEKIWWHLLRTLLAVGALFGFFYGLANMPLVDAFSLGYTAPLMMTALSAIFLREPVGWRRWSAVVIGCLGVLVILRPNNGALSLAAIAVLVAAFCYACQAITARRLSATESTLSLSFYAIVGPMLVSLGFINDGSWLNPDLTGWVLLVGAGLSSVMAWIGLMNGYRAASPALLAPLEYTALVGGAIAGYVIWDEVPDVWVAVGALIIVASGLFVVYRSREVTTPIPDSGSSSARKKKAGSRPPL